MTQEPVGAGRHNMTSLLVVLVFVVVVVDVAVVAAAVAAFCAIGSGAATWFGVEGLRAAGEPVESPVITKAVDFMLA